MRFFQKKRQKEEFENSPMLLDADFDQVMQRVKCEIDDLEGAEQKTAFLEYAIEAIKLDVVTSAYTQLLYLGKPVKSYDLPFSYDSSIARKVNVDLSKSSVLSVPWEFKKMINAAVDIHEDGFLDDGNHFDAYYLPEIDLIVIRNGRHHGAAAAIFKKGTITASELSLRECLPFYRATAQGWYIAEYNRCNPMSDPRLGILFELFRMKCEIEDASPFAAGSG